jgi:hypothetical protein
MYNEIIDITDYETHLSIIKKYGTTLYYFTNRSYELCFEAVKYDTNTLKYVIKQTHKYV